MEDPKSDIDQYLIWNVFFYNWFDGTNAATSPNRMFLWTCHINVWAFFFWGKLHDEFYVQGTYTYAYT